MELAEGDVDELIEFWTLLDEDRALLVGKRGASALGFALLLKHYSHVGRFPRGRSDLSDAVIEFVARQVGVDASDLGFYEWSGRTIEYHRPEYSSAQWTTVCQERGVARKAACCGSSAPAPGL